MTTTSQGRGAAWADLLGQMERTLAEFLSRVEAQQPVEARSIGAETPPRPDPLPAQLAQADEQAARAALALTAAQEALQQWRTKVKECENGTRMNTDQTDLHG